MNDNYLITLTFAVFQAAENWEEADFLKFKLKALACEVLKGVIANACARPEQGLKQKIGKISKDIDELENVFKKARNQKLITRQQFVLFQKEYAGLKKELNEKNILTETKTAKAGKTANIVEKNPEKSKQQKQEKQEKPQKPEKEATPPDLSERQKKILQVLKQKSGAQVWQINEVLSGVSKRTLRRDLDELLKSGLVKRQGQWNEIYYDLV